MNLRRLIEHLKGQHWTAVGIDFVIVVVGVFVGIQVSNWNQQRATDKQAAIFTTHLKEDLREEDWVYQLMIGYNRQVLANAERAANALSGSSTMSDEAFLVSAYRATQYKQRLRRRATYDELVSTGAIGLIKDRNLRDLAMRVYNMPIIENISRDGIQSRYREEFRMSLPIEVQRALTRNCGDRPTQVGDYQAITDALDYPCRTGLSEASIRESAAALRSNPTLLPLLRLRIVDIDTRLGDMNGFNYVEVREGLRAVAKEKP
jgi:hypothetical protein